MEVPECFSTSTYFKIPTEEFVQRGIDARESVARQGRRMRNASKRSPGSAGEAGQNTNIHVIVGYTYQYEHVVNIPHCFEYSIYLPDLCNHVIA